LINVSLELGSADKDVADMFQSNMGNVEQLFASLIKEGQASGEISRKFTAKALSRVLYNSMTGLRVTGMNRPDVEALREIVKLTLSILDE
jgi:TetR/AcrR family transcriptional repressor of nem operon